MSHVGKFSIQIEFSHLLGKICITSHHSPNKLYSGLFCEPGEVRRVEWDDKSRLDPIRFRVDSSSSFEFTYLTRAYDSSGVMWVIELCHYECKHRSRHVIYTADHRISFVVSHFEVRVELSYLKSMWASQAHEGLLYEWSDSWDGLIRMSWLSSTLINWFIWRVTSIRLRFFTLSSMSM